MIFHSIFHVDHVNVITFSFYKTNNITIIDETNKICREKLWLNATNTERQYIERHLVSMRYRVNSCNRIMLRHVLCPSTIFKPNQLPQTRVRERERERVCVCVCVFPAVAPCLRLLRGLHYFASTRTAGNSTTTWKVCEHVKNVGERERWIWGGYGLRRYNLDKHWTPKAKPVSTLTSLLAHAQ